jgi:hypothetical protein
MAVINSENAASWQTLANEASAQRPDVGTRVRVTSGKHKDAEGTVLRHQRSKYGNAFRYGSEGNLQLREIMGRRGFVALVRLDSGASAWIDAEKLFVIKP